MAFRFQRQESVAAGFARIAGEQIKEAVAALETSPEHGVHHARQATKRLRSLLQLFRRALPDGSYEREDEALRAANHRLSMRRDTEVRIAVFDALTKGIKTPGVAAARRQLVAVLPTASGSADPPASLSRSTITALRAFGARLPGLKPDAGWSVLSRGLKATYRRARQAHAAARADLSTTAMHTWRRRSKDFECQLQLLRKIDPPALKRRIRQASRVNELLGDDHDLAVLGRTLASLEKLPVKLREKLNLRIARRRKKLQRRAFAAGSELFFERPSVVVENLAKPWKRWRRR